MARGVRNHKWSSVSLIIVLLILSISSNQIVIKVAAPPVGGSSSSGILTSTGSEIRIVEAFVNMSVESHPYLDSYHTHTIQIEGVLNITNPTSDNESLLLLYNPSWEGYSSFLNETSFEAYIEGIPLAFTNQTIANITHPRELPSEFHDRFPEWVYVHDQLWYSPTHFTLLNLSLGPHQSVILHFYDLIIVTTVSVNSSQVGFGLGVEQIESDLTQIRLQITVIEGSQFIDLNPYPYDAAVESQDGNDYTFTWDAQPPYSSQLIYGITPEPVRAGFMVQMEVTEYHLPFINSTTSTSYSTDPTTQNPSTVSLLIAAGLGLFILAFFVIWMKRC